MVWHAYLCLNIIPVTVRHHFTVFHKLDNELVTIAEKIDVIVLGQYHWRVCIDNVPGKSEVTLMANTF